MTHKASQHMQRITRKVMRRIVAIALVFAGFLLLWQAIAASGLFPPVLLPAPLDVAYALVELLQSGALMEHAVASVMRVLAGFILAAFLAIPLGITFGWYKQLGSAFYPLIQVLRTISPIAWIPLAILWFGIGDAPAIFIIFITAFFPILIATMHARRHIDPALVKTAINFGASGRDLLLKIIFPASFPYVMVGLRIALGIAWVIVVAAEMVGMRSGLGFMILDARNFLRTDLVIAGMVSIGVIGFVLDTLMSSFERRVERHKQQVENILNLKEEATT